jgi:hypothetical protein
VVVYGGEPALDLLARIEVHPDVERCDHQGELTAKAETLKVALPELDPLASGTGEPSEPIAGLRQHRRHRFHAHDLDAGLGDRERHPAGAHAELEHRASRLDRQVRVEANVMASAAVRLVVVPTVLVMRF